VCLSSFGFAVLGGEVLTINRAFVESEADPNGNMRFHALALLKPLVYAEVESEEFVCDILSTLTLHRPYPKKFHDDLLKTMQEHLEDQESLGEFWKVAHTRMCTRISDEIQSNKSNGVNNNKHTDDMFAAMVESVGNLKLSADDTITYVLGGIEWCVYLALLSAACSEYAAKSSCTNITNCAKYIW